MARRPKRPKKGDERRGSKGSTPGSGSPEERTGDASRRSPGKLRRWYQTNRSDLRFLLVFGSCLALFYLSTLAPPVKNGFFPAYLRANAQVSGAILQACSQDVTVRGQSLISGHGPAIEIERGCDAVEPSALFVAAVLASPVSLFSRLSAAIVGTIVLMLINLIRIISLFLVRIYYPDAFETMHLDVWQALFIVLAIVLWGMWASRMTRGQVAHAKPST